MSRPTNVLWLIDHVCYDGSLHGGGRLFMNLVPKFDPARVRIHPYFLRASSEVQEVFKTADRKVTNLNLGKYDLRTLPRLARLACRNGKVFGAIEIRDDVARDRERMRIVLGEMIGNARDRRMHVGAA